MKVLIIGLDGGTWDVLDDFILDNHMPNLKRLKCEGYSGVLQSTEPPLTAPAWTTCITGCHPQKHGIYNFFQYYHKEDKLRVTTTDDCLVPNMWQELSRQNYKVASINVPLTYPCQKVNGIVVAGCGCPGPESQFTYPVDFKDELLKHIPDYEIMGKWEKSQDYSIEMLESNIAQVERSFEQRVATAELVSKKINWDVMMIQFHDIDMMQHPIWSYLDKRSRDAYPVKRDKLFRIFQKLDAAISDLITLAETRDLLVAVVSDHGFRKKIGSVKPNMMLAQWGYLKLRWPTNQWGRLLRNLHHKWDSLLFSREKRKLRKHENHVKTHFLWLRSKAAMIQSHINGYVYLNVKGRQPFGTVSPSEEYDEVINELRKRFSQVKNPLTGENVFARVATPSELYDGLDPADSERLGDLILVPDHGFRINPSGSRKYECITMLPETSTEGMHHYHGIYIFSGPDVKTRSEKRNHIVDIAPTIYAALGAKLPSYMDGKVLQDIFIKEKQVNYKESQTGISPRSGGRQRISTVEKTEINKRLSALGYIE